MAPVGNLEFAKIYKLCSLQTDRIYIGSTTQRYLSYRFSSHRGDYKKFLDGKRTNITSCELLKYDDCWIELITSVDNCKSLDELHKIEGEYIRQYRDICVNKCIAGRSIEQYKKDNNDRIKEQQSQYYKKNSESIKERSAKYYRCNNESIKNRVAKYYRCNNEKHSCECGVSYVTKNKIRHERSNKHIKWVDETYLGNIEPDLFLN